MRTVSPQDYAERALAACAADGCLVLVRACDTANLRWARGTLTTNGEASDTSVTVVAIVGEGAGAASRSGLDLDALPELVAAARRAAEEAGPSRDAQPLVPSGGSATGWDEGPARTSGAAFAALAPALGEMFRAGAADGIEHFGYTEHAMTTTYLATSTGLRLRHVQPEGRFEVTAKSHERTRSAWSGSAARDLATVDVPATDALLREQLGWQARTVPLAPGRHAALLTPSAVADLMIDLYWSAIGQEAAEGRSVFSAPGGGTRLGERLGPAGLRLQSDPVMTGLECEPFVTASASSSAASVFDNGLPLAATDWVRDGVLTGLITTRATAAQYDLQVRPAVDNLQLSLAAGNGTLADLVGRTEDGVLVTCLWYNRVVDPQTLLLTGLTRDGVYVVRGGEVVGAASNFRFNDSPVAALSRIVDAGATVPTLAREMGDYFNRCAMPPLLVSDFNFSTVSQAS